MKKIIKLTENDLTKLVRKIIKEQNEDKVYLEFSYTTNDGDEEYDDYENETLYLRGSIPRESFIDICTQNRVNPSTEIGREIEFNTSVGEELTDLLSRSYDVYSFDGRNQEIEPDFQIGWTEGIITIVNENFERNY